MYGDQEGQYWYDHKMKTGYKQPRGRPTQRRIVKDFWVKKM